jgi:uncharacterized BrkB/YihY/UPF0761 family membrane protein
MNTKLCLLFSGKNTDSGYLRQCWGQQEHRKIQKSFIIIILLLLLLLLLLPLLGARGGVID